MPQWPRMLLNRCLSWRDEASHIVRHAPETAARRRVRLAGIPPIGRSKQGILQLRVLGPSENVYLLKEQERGLSVPVSQRGASPLPGCETRQHEIQAEDKLGIHIAVCEDARDFH